MSQRSAKGISTQSPFSPEPPRRHIIVDLAMALAGRRGDAQLASPHLHGGENEAKLRYGYEVPDDFWGTVAPYAFLADLADCELLDIGCGWGGKTIRYAEVAHPRCITGFDLPGVYDPEVPRSFAGRRGVSNSRFVEATAEEMPFGESSFDIAIMDDVMEHVRSPATVLADCGAPLRELLGSSVVLVGLRELP